MSAEYLAYWGDIEPLLDKTLALPEHKRAGFLDSLPPGQQRWRGLIAELLRHEAKAAEVGFLSLAASLPAFAPSDTRAEQPPGQALRAGQVVGPWLLLEELGRGGMASVWLARRREGDFLREVALKLPHSPSPQWAERFKRERDILARLSHPGIARLLDAGLSQTGLPWLAMERVQGQEILAWCAQRQADVPQRVGLLLQIADAMQYAHSQLVLHRDIKPGNILVQDDGQLRLLDFGIARLLATDESADRDPALTQLGQRPMTPEYASPEQVRGEEPGIASDVYAFGVLAYRLLSGQGPYAGAAPASRHALEQAVLDWLPPPPSTQAQTPGLRKALRGDLDTIVLKALAKQPAQRFPTMDAVAADLRRHLAGLPVLARAPSWRYVAGRVLRRHRTAVAAGVLAIAALLGTTVWALRSADQARQEAARSDAMYGFVVGLFNPNHSPQPDIREREMPVRQLIERGAQRVLGALQEQPQARERLLADLATLTQQLGLNALSTQLTSERVRMALLNHGANSVAYADALLGQRDGWEAQGQYRQGYEAAAQALKIYQAQGVQDPIKLARAHMTLGGFGGRLHAPGADDIGHLRKAAELLQAVNGPSPLGTVYEQLLVAHLSLGRTEEAFQDAISGVDVNRRQWGSDDWKTGASEDQAGALAAMTLRPAQAETLLRHGIDVIRRSMGPEALLLARGEVNLAQLLFAGDRRDEAVRHLQEAQRIVRLPAHAAQKAFSLTVEATALELAQRAGDWPGLRQACRAWGRDVQAPQPAMRLRIIQACAASAVHEHDDARADALLDQGQQIIDQNFAKVPARAAVLALRTGELAWARGDAVAAIAAWRQCLAKADATGLAWQAQAWRLIARHASLDPAELERLQSFTQQLQQAGGERYYAEYLQLLRDARSAPSQR
ncbi:serine/threonine-protein kinase [Paucibacter soli]|uniref:serine/threonine-protein kinase n=1 Tax=Paucibacter soli TaxID=3133433 RepID=UPI00309A5608